MLGPGLDGLDERVHGAEHCALEAALGQQREPALYLIDPARTGGREMKMPPGSFGVGQPFGHRRRLMGGQVVEHDVDLLILGQVEIDQLEEGQHVGGGVALAGVVEDLAGGHVHRREQIGRAMPFVVVSHGARPAPDHRQRWLGPIERLYLGFLVETESSRPGRRVQIEPDHINQLLLEVRVVGDLEGVDPPRLEPVLAPDPGHSVLAQPMTGCHRSGRPMRRAVVGADMQRVMNDRRLHL